MAHRKISVSKKKKKKQKHTVLKGINNVKFQGVPSTWYKPQTQALFKSNNLDPQAEWGDYVYTHFISQEYPDNSENLKKIRVLAETPRKDFIKPPPRSLINRKKNLKIKR